MKSRALAVCAAVCASLLLMSFMPAGMLAAATLDQSNLQSNTGLCDSFTFYAQTFTAGKTGPLVGVDLYIAAGNMSAYDAGLTIRQVDGSTGCRPERTRTYPMFTWQLTSQAWSTFRFQGMSSLRPEPSTRSSTRDGMEAWSPIPTGSICLIFGGSYAGGQGLNWSMGSPPRGAMSGNGPFKRMLTLRMPTRRRRPHQLPARAHCPRQADDLIATGGNGAASVSWMGPSTMVEAP